VPKKTAVLVTGVSSGIGRAALRELVAAGYRVFGTVRRARDTAQVQEAGAVPIIMDVTLRSSIVRAQETVARALGDTPLSGVVNNAGIHGVGPVELVDIEEVKRVFEVNLFGTISVTQVFLPMLRASQGRIINISSVSALLALPFAGPYAASKSALEAFSDSLRRELNATGVRVVVIQPGSVRTPIWAKLAGTDLGLVKGTIYQRAVEKVKAMALHGGEHGLQPDVIGRAVLEAMQSPDPPTRIMVVDRGGWKRRLLKFLPDRWVDRMIAKRLNS
jgi:NAD(P)-dependent dehydrogenase (short-subunit alcohol dehydrogenase family)